MEENKHEKPAKAKSPYAPSDLPRSRLSLSGEAFLEHMALSSRGALAAPLLPVGVTPGPAMAGEAQKSSPGSQGPRKRWQRPSPAAPQRPPESGRGREERAGPDPCLAADSPGRSGNGSSFIPLAWTSLPLPSRRGGSARSWHFKRVRRSLDREG